MASSATVPTTGSPYSDLPPVVSQLLEAKARKGLTFAQVAATIGKDEVWVAALFYGQAKGTPEELTALAAALDIPQDNVVAQLGPHWFPNRGIGPIPPTDPLLYRLFEGTLVYGHAIKAVIHEKFGDGIMSMIDCKVHIDKKSDPKGDRVILTFKPLSEVRM
ncbi:cyanate lyase C-terminal domain-containing protein [Amylostereum chailletii]|nr:cyanate lyase C-terminal domain-containing protein [Amylostereum chailletii]